MRAEGGRVISAAGEPLPFLHTYAIPDKGVSR